MGRQKIILLAGIALVLILVVGTSIVMAGGGAERGYTFTMVMQVGDRDPVEFEGIALGNNLRLSGGVGGIETVTLLAGSDLWILTPSVKTARKVDNPAPPAMDESGWVDWLIEPGRINPMKFAALLGLADDVDGDRPAGTGGGIKFSFDDGTLLSVEFPAGRGDGQVSYTYSDIERDNGITQADVSIPADFMKID